MMLLFDLRKTGILKCNRHSKDDLILKCLIEKEKRLNEKGKFGTYKLLAGKNRCLILEKSIIKCFIVRK